MRVLASSLSRNLAEAHVKRTTAEPVVENKPVVTNGFKRMTESGGIAARHMSRCATCNETMTLDCQNYDEATKACKIGVDEANVQVAKGDTCPVPNQTGCPKYKGPDNSVSSEDGTSVGESCGDKKKLKKKNEDGSESEEDADETDCPECGKKLKDGKCPDCDKDGEKDESIDILEADDAKSAASWILSKISQMNANRTGQVSVADLVSLIRKQFDIA